MDIFVTVSCSIFILVVLFIIIVIKTVKIINKLSNIESKQDKLDAFLIPTYNNSIRISKKLNVYYQYNKEDYINHKLDKFKDIKDQ